MALKSQLQTYNFYYYFNLFTFFRLLSGQERHEISYAMLVFDATKEVGYKGPGAHHAEIRKEPPRGLALYPIVFSHPWEDPEELKPSLISAITEWNLDLKTCNKVVYSYDQRVCNAFIKLLLKFIHSEKATKFCEIPTNYLTGST